MLNFTTIATEITLEERFYEIWRKEREKSKKKKKSSKKKSEFNKMDPE